MHGASCLEVEAVQYVYCQVMGCIRSCCLGMWLKTSTHNAGTRYPLCNNAKKRDKRIYATTKQMLLLTWNASYQLSVCLILKSTNVLYLPSTWYLELVAL